MPGHGAYRWRRFEGGLTERRLPRRTDDPEQVAIVFPAADLGRAKAFAESDDLRETMQTVGIVARPDMVVLGG